MTESYLKAEGWLTAAERRLLFFLAANVEASAHSAIVNIGVEYGASIVCLRAGNPRARIVGIDVDLSKRKFNADTMLIELVEADSGAYIEKYVNLEHPSISLLFIDGDHSRAGVLRDTAYCELVEVGGVVAFHDAYQWRETPKTPHFLVPEVNQAIEEWFKIKRHSWVELDPVDSIRLFRRLS